MDIAAFISELLEHQDELVVPGLGTFYRSNVEGYYDRDQGLFYPPTLQLKFDPDHTVNDGKLLEQLTDAMDGNSGMAEHHLEKFVSYTLRQVETDTVPLGELGSFSMRRNKLFFQAKRLSNNNQLYYGLVPVRIQHAQHPQAINETIVKAPLSVPVTEKPSEFTAALLRGEPMPAARESEELNEEEIIAEKKTKLSTWILLAALVLLLTGIGLIFAYRSNPGLFDRFHGNNEPPPVSNKNREKVVSDSIEQALKAQRDIGIAPRVDSATLKKIVPDAAPVDTFGIVIGTYETLGGAQKDYDRLRVKGLNVEIRKMPNRRRYELDVATFFNIDSAKAQLPDYQRRLRDKTIHIETYPYIKK